MFDVVFYSDSSGFSDVEESIMSLSEKASRDKSCRIQFNQIVLYVKLLQKNGKNLPSKLSKHLSGEIWELRPGRNRILYCYIDSVGYVLLRIFTKKTQKTPSREIQLAIKRMNELLERKEVNNK